MTKRGLPTFPDSISAGSYAQPGYTPPGLGKKPKAVEATKGATPVVAIGAPSVPGIVRVICADMHTILRSYMTEDGAQLTGGGGGIQRIARPRRVSVPDYQGVDPYTMTVGLRLDGWDDDRSVEPECDFVRAIARDVTSLSGPPTITVTGPVPLGGPSFKWLVDDLSWGAALWHPSRHGQTDFRVRQDVTLTLVQYIEVDTVAISPAKKAAAKKKDAKKTDKKSGSKKPSFSLQSSKVTQTDATTEGI